MKKISIIVPVYNEINTLEKVIDRLQEVPFCGLEKEIIIVDDYSTDGTRELIKDYEGMYKVFYHDYNQGKGAAIRTGFSHVTGDIMVIQDADLEYDPADYDDLIKALDTTVEFCSSTDTCQNFDTECSPFYAFCYYEKKEKVKFLNYLKTAVEKSPGVVARLFESVFPESLDVKDYYTYAERGMLNSKIK